MTNSGLELQGWYDFSNRKLGAAGQLVLSQADHLLLLVFQQGMMLLRR